MLQDYSKYTLVKRGRLERLLWFGLPPASFALLLLFTFLALSPIGLGTDAHAEGASQTFAGYLSPSVTLEIADVTHTNIDPKVGGQFGVVSTVAHVEVNNSAWYDVNISGDINLTAQTSDNSSVIRPINNATTSSGFDTNTWGYNVTKNTSGSAAVAPTADTVYKPMTSTDTKVETGYDNTSRIPTGHADDYYTLSFGANVDTTIPADIYRSQVTFSVVANPKTVSGLAAIDTMQQLNATACSNIGKDAQDEQYKHTDQFGLTYWAKQLTDERDGNVYWMAKLADGNCWMTQNLALNLSKTNGLAQNTNGGAVGKLTSTTSNVSGDWTPIADTITPAAGNDRFNVGADNDLNKNAYNSWNEGKYVLYNPGKGDSAFNIGMSATQGGLAGWASSSTLTVGPSDMKAPSTLGGGVVVNVSGSEWKASDDPEFTSKHGGKTVDETSHTYDAHYLIGNYYQWLAATAQTVAQGEGVATADTKVNNSICPANWQLPESGPNRNDNDGSFFHLLSQYVTGTTLDGGKTQNGAAALTGPAKGTSKTLENVLTGAPLSFLRSGNVHPWANANQVWNVGLYGNFWSAIASSGTSAHDLNFDPSRACPSFSYNRGAGFSIRCLVKTDKTGV